MASQVSFRWLLTLLALAAPTVLGPFQPASEQEPGSSPQQASSDVIFRHYL